MTARTLAESGETHCSGAETHGVPLSNRADAAASAAFVSAQRPTAAPIAAPRHRMHAADPFQNSIEEVR
jgi:hypothetical protein